MKSLAAAFCLSALMAVSASARPLGLQDIGPLSNEGLAEFNQKYPGKLFTARMVVEHVTNRGGVYGVRFTSDEVKSGYYNVTCYVENERELIGAEQGEVLWVSGLVTEAQFKGSFHLSPCEISLSKEPWDTPQPWKLHPPRE